MQTRADRLFGAVSVLVTHGPIKQRLIKAYEEHLDDIEDDELPITVQESFAALRRLMHVVVPAAGEGSTCASVRKMSKVEADQCAQLIVDICGEVALHEDVSRPLPLSGDETVVIPPFLVKSV